jgi:hypothetical protein
MKQKEEIKIKDKYFVFRENRDNSWSCVDEDGFDTKEEAEKEMEDWGEESFNYIVIKGKKMKVDDYPITQHSIIGE